MSEFQENQVQSDHPQETVSKARKRRGRRLLKWTLIPVGSLVGLLLLAILGVAFVLTPARLTPIVNEWAGRYLQAEVRFDTVRLSLLKHFPHVTLQLVEGEIVSHAFNGLPDSLRAEIPASVDTLLRFDRFTATVNLNALMASRLVIRQLELERPRIRAYVAANGKANWEIYTSDTTATDSTASTDLDFMIRRLKLNRAELQYESVPDSLYGQVSLDHLSLRGGRGHRYRVDLAAQATLHRDTLRLCDTLPLQLQGGFAYDVRQPLRLALDSLRVAVDDLPATFTGTVEVVGDSINGDLNCRMQPWRLQSIVDLIPSQMMPRMRHFQTSLTADFNTTIRGTYLLSSGKLPVVSLDCKVDGGYLRYEGARASIDQLVLDLSMYYHPLKPDSTGLELRRFRVDGSGVNLSASASAWNLTGNTRLKTQLEGSLDLDRIGTLFPFPQGIRAHGTVGLKLQANVRKDQLNLRQIGQSKINARIDLNNFLLDMPEDTILLAAQGGHIFFGANENRMSRDSLTIPPGEQVVYVGVQADSLHVLYKYRMAVKASGARITAQNAASAFSGDSTVIHPFKGVAETRYLEINTLDSTWVKTEDAMTSFTIRPSSEDPTVPHLALSVGAMTLTMKSQANFYQLNGTDVRLEATLSRLNRKGQRMRVEQLRDSLQQVYPTVPRDSLFAHVAALHRKVRVPDDFAAEDIDMKLDDRITALLWRWNAQGSIYAINGHVGTPYFPLRTSLRNVDITFTTDEVDLNGTRIEAGSSQMELTGKISGLRRALSGRGRLNIGMQLVSDTLDVNELLLAANAGMVYAESDQRHKDSVLRALNEANLEQMYVDTTEAETGGGLLVIPANVDATFDVEVNHGIYADIVLRKLLGELIVRDRCLQLNGLKAVTDAGEMSLTALYATRSRSDITAGFDLEMHRMQVERLIRSVPSVDTLLPMLRSFEGVVDCQLAATVALDTAMNFILPTLRGVGRIHGDSLVLLDGETFSEIARMMRFKNRKRNLIDHISVEMIMRDNQIELFPFVIEMDRYQAAVSGIQRLDMSFDYHISVLKSPIPFRLGINISGTPDKFKWKLCRARYKSANVPTYVELIDSTRLNLRHTLTDVFRRGVQAASLSRLQAASTVDAPAEMEGAEENLTAADSVLLQQNGVLPGDTVSTADTVGLNASPATLTTPDPTLERGAEPDASAEDLTPAERRRQRREARRAAKQREATLPEEMSL